MTIEAKKFTDASAQLEWNLTNHTPNAEQVMMIEDVRRWCKKAGFAIIASCPPGRERSMAITALEDACMHAVAAIARAEVTPDG